MSDFDDLIQSGASEAAIMMDDPIDVRGQSVPSIFDEDSMQVGVELYGDTEDITARAVVSLADLAADNLPQQRDKVYRHRNKRTYSVVSVSTDAGHCNMQLVRDGQRHGA